MKGSMNFVAIDFETANYQPDSACAVGLVKVVGGEIVDQAVHLIRPPTREFVFTHIHGLRWKDVANADDFGTLWPRLEPMLDGAEFFAAHNAPFDKGVLRACCARYGIARAVAAVSLHGADFPPRLEHPSDEAFRRLREASHRAQPPRSAVRRDGVREDRSRGREDIRLVARRRRSASATTRGRRYRA